MIYFFRYLSISKPLSSINTSKQRRRAKYVFVFHPNQNVYCAKNGKFQHFYSLIIWDFFFCQWRFIFSVCLGTPTNLIQQHYLVWLHSTEYNWFCSYFRLMVMLAWLMTLIFSWPQAVIFRVMKHPNKEFYQCTTFNFFENLALGIGNDSFYRKLKQVIECWRVVIQNLCLL